MKDLHYFNYYIQAVKDFPEKRLVSEAGSPRTVF